MHEYELRSFAHRAHHMVKTPNCNFDTFIYKINISKKSSQQLLQAKLIITEHKCSGHPYMSYLLF